MFDLGSFRAVIYNGIDEYRKETIARAGAIHSIRLKNIADIIRIVSNENAYSDKDLVIRVMSYIDNIRTKKDSSIFFNSNYSLLREILRKKINEYFFSITEEEEKAPIVIKMKSEISALEKTNKSYEHEIAKLKKSYKDLSDERTILINRLETYNVDVVEEKVNESTSSDHTFLKQEEFLVVMNKMINKIDHMSNLIEQQNLIIVAQAEQIELLKKNNYELEQKIQSIFTTSNKS